MATLKRFEARCAALGCTIDRDAYRVIVDAPIGKIFSGMHTHCIRLEYRGFWRAEVYQALLDDMSDGVEDCFINDCDVCRENGASLQHKE